MKQQLLLLEDVESLGKKGEIVSAKPGYVRNFLLPQSLAIVASAHTLRKQERLREERAKQAVVDRKESETLAQQIEGLTVAIKVKVDPEGHMYGSVSAVDVAHLFVEKGISIDRRHVILSKPIKQTGVHKLQVKLKEGIIASFHLSIIPEGMVVQPGEEKITQPLPSEAPPSDEPS